MKNSSNNSKKIPIIIGAVFLLIVAIAVAVFMSTGKPGETNKDVDLKGSTTANIEHKIEYGEDIKDKTFTVNTEKGEKEANFADLNPEVDTMIIGKTEHQLEIEKETFDVIVVVKDTKKPVMSGVEETIELKVENVEEVNVENELKELITAEDPVDGNLEVVFEVEKDEKVKNKYNVIATATDKNGNDIVEKFVVKVKQSKKTSDNKENNEDDKETEKDSNEATGSSTDGTSSNTGSNNSANTGNSEGNKSSDSNKGASSNTGSNSNVNKGNQANSGGSANTAPKAQPKPQAPAKPKPQAPAKPKPEPKPTPPANDGLQKPANLPTGTSIIEQHLNSHLYSYQKNLSDGGKVNEIIVNKVTTSVVGIDRNGAEFTMSYNNSTKEYYYRMSNPSFSSESLSEVQGIAVAFSTAYGF